MASSVCSSQCVNSDKAHTSGRCQGRAREGQVVRIQTNPFGRGALAGSELDIELLHSVGSFNDLSTSQAVGICPTDNRCLVWRAYRSEGVIKVKHPAHDDLSPFQRGVRHAVEPVNGLILNEMAVGQIELVVRFGDSEGICKFACWASLFEGPEPFSIRILRLITLSPVQRSEERRLRPAGSFSRRLQLGPGLKPPSSWSLSPASTPNIYGRAESLKSPGLEAIYLSGQATTRNPSVWRGAIPSAIESVFP